MSDLALRFNRDTIIIDGAHGTLTQSEGIDADISEVFLNILEPELVMSIHRRYLAAGAQALTSFSFTGSRPALAKHGLADRLAELNAEAVRLTKACKPEHVLADVGPCGLLLAPLGETSFDEMFAIYAEQITALAAEDPDAILLETFTDIAEARCALLAAKSVCTLPVIVSCSFAATGRMYLSGTDPATAAIILEAAGADVIGCNCGEVSPAEMVALTRAMAEHCSLPLLAQPNAGKPLPDASGDVSYAGSPDELAEAALAEQRLGVQFLGSCCGTTPTHTAALFAVVGETDVCTRPPLPEGMLLASPRGHLHIATDRPCRVIGESINPSGKSDLDQALQAGETETVVSLAVDEVIAGVDLVDVNVGLVPAQARALLPQLALELAFNCQVPLVFDSLDADALEAALRVYPGRALLNSTTADARALQRILPIARRYGAGVIALCYGGKHLPESVDARLQAADTILQAAKAAGLDRNDLLFDVLVLPVSDFADDRERAIAAIRGLKQHGLLSLAGITNLSFTAADRPGLNRDFAAEAKDAGLDVAIINPFQPEVMAIFSSD